MTYDEELHVLLADGVYSSGFNDRTTRNPALAAERHPTRNSDRGSPDGHADEWHEGMVAVCFRAR